MREQLDQQTAQCRAAESDLAAFRMVLEACKVGGAEKRTALEELQCLQDTEQD